MALAASFVEIRFQFPAALRVVLDLPKVGPLRTKRFRKGISQTERDELRQTRFIAMREITSLVPAAKTLPDIFNDWRR